MKILFVGPNFLHPTTKGGQIRTLEMLRCLSRQHQLHYVSFLDPQHPEAVGLARQYSAQNSPISITVPSKRSWRFALQAGASLFQPLPLAVSRWASPAMQTEVARLQATGAFDCTVCDFLAVAPNILDWRRTILFQHNVEAVIWQRRAAVASPWQRPYIQLQAERMRRYEAAICRQAAAVVAVSDTDAEYFRSDYGVTNCTAIPTGVDFDYFQPQQTPEAAPHDLVFVGSMDWMPNLDGMAWFLDEVFPLIRAQRPATSLAIVGRSPSPELVRKAQALPHVTVTGTVPDVRPYLWHSALSIVPLRIGGGTRLKIYEAVAARLPVVSTTIGAEGLDLLSPVHIRRADTAADFARDCLALLNDPAQRAALSQAAHDHIAGRYTWTAVSQQFADLLQQAIG